MSTWGRPITWVIECWRRRYWIADPAVLAGAANATPAVVLTGASDGIGKALAKVLSGAQPLRQHKIILIARTAEHLASVARDIAQTDRPSPIALALDLTAHDAADQIAACLAREGLYADVLINCAGMGQAGAFVDADSDVLDRLQRLNIEAVTALTRRFLPGMLARGRGGIVNVASLGGVTPGPYQAAYYASKAYVIALTEGIAWEARGQGVRIMVAAPGPVATGFHDRMHAGAALYRTLGLTMSPDAVARSIWRGYCMGRTVMVPGVLPALLALTARFTPHVLLVPVVGVLLKPRGIVRDVERQSQH